MAKLGETGGSRIESTRTLDLLKDGEEASLERIDLPEEDARRLMEMGFLPGTLIVAGRKSPFGDPRVFRVDGSEVALRQETAAHLYLRPAGAAAESDDEPVS